MFLGKLKHSHHLLWLFTEKITAIRVELLFADKEGFQWSLPWPDQRQKTKKRPCFIAGPAAGKLLRNPFRNSKNISRMPVVVPHERFASQLAIALGII